MIMRTYIVTFLLLLSATVSFSQFTIKQKLGSFAEVSFPEKPVSSPFDHGWMYIARYDTVTYSARVADFSKSVKDYDNHHYLDTIYDQIISVYLKNSNGRVFYKNKIQINGTPGIELGYRGEKDGRIFFGYERVAHLNDTLISASFYSLDSLPKTDNKLTSFFNTFKINKKENAFNSVAFETGLKIGKILGYMLALTVTVSIAFFLIYIIKKIGSRITNHE